ncbi:MAG: TonB-dependent receptor, partial [Acidobacteria bacterium]|nr:TonB-dependent receptor [Acidobacteriota bacterium]
LRQNQFGGTLGGPVRKNRTFYFGSLEATSTHTTENRLVTVPTGPERRGIFDPTVVIVRDPVTGTAFPANTIPLERWDPVAAGLLRLWPEANFAGTTRANHSSSPNQVRLRRQYDGRIDHLFSTRDRMFVRASWMDFSGERHGPFPAPGIGGGNNDFARDDNTAFNVALSETHVFGSSVVHEVRVGVNSLRTNKRPLAAGFPNEDFGLHVGGSRAIEGLSRINLTGALSYAPLGEFQFNPNDKTAGTFQVLDNLSIAKGAHALKVGTDLRWIRSDSVGAQFARGIFNFNGRFSGSSFGDFLLGMTSSRQFSTIQHGSLRERDYMFYVQDDWRIAPRLTLNGGIRYELASPRFDTQNRMSALDPSAFPDVRVIRAGERGGSWSDRALVQTDTNNWAPRLGLAFQPASLWTVRAAAGIFYGTPKGLGPAVYLLNNWPHARDVTVPSTSARSAGQLADGIDESLLGSATEMPPNLAWSLWSSDFTSPTISQWNVSVQRQLARSWVVTTAYVGSSSRHLQRVSNINAAGPGDPGSERERRMIPSLGAIMVTESSGAGSYHGLQTTIDKRLSHGTQGSLSYTWGHSIDDVTEPSGAEGNVISQDRRNIRGDRGNSGFDRRHRLVAHALLDLPFGNERRWFAGGDLLGNIFSGWQVSGIVSIQSGAPFDVTIVDPTNRLGVTPGSSAWRPDVIGNPRLPHPTTDAWVDSAAFAVPQNPDGTYRYGNLGRNSLRGPGYFSVDAALTRDFRVGRARRLQLRWEMFNATNHPSYGLPNADLGSADFGTILSTVSSPRQMQFGLKFVF